LVLVSKLGGLHHRGIRKEIARPEFRQKKKAEQMENSSPNPSFSICDIQIQKQISRSFAKTIFWGFGFGKNETNLFFEFCPRGGGIWGGIHAGCFHFYFDANNDKIQNVMEQPPNIEKKEAQPKLLFKVVLMRHEEPHYKDEGHDLTDKGVAGAIETGKKLKEDDFFSDENPIHLFHSPKPRAEGTLDFVAQGAEIPTENKRAIDAIGQSKIANREAFIERVIELNSDQEKIAEDHYKHEMHKNRPDIIEPHEKKKKRLYRAMEYLIRSIKIKNVDGSDATTPQILAVSHFEIVTHLIDDVFGIENVGKYNSPSFGEQVKITGFQTDEKDKILLTVAFRDLEKQVVFNRATRSIEQIV